MCPSAHSFPFLPASLISIVVSVPKLLSSGLCGWNNLEIGEGLDQTKNVKGSPDQIAADDLKALQPDCQEKLATSLSLMCWEMKFLEESLGSLTVIAPTVVIVMFVSKFRPIAGLCAIRKILGLRVPQITPSISLRVCEQTALSREWQ